MAQGQEGPPRRRWGRTRVGSEERGEMTLRLWPGFKTRLVRRSSGRKTSLKRLHPAGTSRGRGVVSNGLAPILVDSRMEIESTGTIIVDLGSPRGPPPELLQIGDPVGCLGEGSGVLLIALGPDDVGVPASLAGRGLPSSLPSPLLLNPILTCIRSRRTQEVSGLTPACVT